MRAAFYSEQGPARERCSKSAISRRRSLGRGRCGSAADVAEWLSDWKVRRGGYGRGVIAAAHHPAQRRRGRDRRGWSTRGRASSRRRARAGSGTGSGSRRLWHGRENTLSCRACKPFDAARPYRLMPRARCLGIPAPTAVHAIRSAQIEGEQRSSIVGGAGSVAALCKVQRARSCADRASSPRSVATRRPRRPRRDIAGADADHQLRARKT